VVSDVDTDFVDVENEEPPDETGIDPDDPTTWAPTPDAPYGYLKNGNPRKRRPNKPGSRKSGRRKRSSVQYGKVVEDLITSMSQGIGMAGLASRNTTLIAHSWLLADRAEPVGNAMQGIAEQNPRIAAGIERMAEVSPYAELVAALMPAVPQFLCNMGMIKPGLLGTVDPAKIAASFFAANGQEPPVMDVESEEVPPNGNGAYVSD
jgi:hypothetical protein